MAQAEKRRKRKPILNEERARVIAATFANEISGPNFEITDVRFSLTDVDEWMVGVKPADYQGDGFDSCIMVNDKTGKARYRAEYLAELKEKSL
ncbi:MAG TPA: hypothetical protein VF719_01100 [Abditibacteriaceae bacterium]|jgi:hypothetical protein